MQQELDADDSLVEIQILGVNESGQEAGNPLMTAIGDAPWLQDVDADQDGASDVWGESWSVTFRDVVILDADNAPVGVFNLTEHNLSNTDNYDTLRQLLVDTALKDPGLAWQNPTNRLDVDSDGNVYPLDALIIINALNRMGGQPLPYRGQAPPPPSRYYDVSGDGLLAPLDALIVINDINWRLDHPQAAAAAASAAPESVAGSVAVGGQSFLAGMVSRAEDQAGAEPALPAARQAVERVFADESPDALLPAAVAARRVSAWPHRPDHDPVNTALVVAVESHSAAGPIEPLRLDGFWPEAAGL